MNFRPFLILLFIVVNAVNAFAFDPSTDSGRLEMIHAFSSRHLGFLSENLQFRRSPFELLRQSAQMRAKLGLPAQTVNSASPVIGMEYLGGSDMSYDAVKIESFRNQIQKAATEADPAWFKNDLAENVEQILKNKSGDQKAIIQRWLKIAPLIYDADGKNLGLSQADVISSTQMLSANDLENRYLDTLPNHLMGEVEKASAAPAYQQHIKAFQNQFLGRETKGSFALKAADGTSVGKRSVFLEKIPPEFSIFRGTYGGDCSMFSVPYYSMVDDTETFWIYKKWNPKARPDGYVLVTQATVNGKKYPYIVTVNGASLTSSDAQATVKMIADRYNTTQVLVANMEKNHGVMNYPNIINALKSDEAVTATLHPKWDLAEKENKYGAYYRSENLKSARLLDTESFAIKTHQVKELESTLSYAIPKGGIRELPLFERALLAGYSQMEGNALINFLKSPLIARNLGLTLSQAQVGKKLFLSSHTNPMNTKLFLAAQKHLGFQLKDIEKLDVLARTSGLANLHRETPSLATPEEWHTLAERFHKQIFKQLPEDTDNATVITTALHQDAQLAGLLKGKNVLEGFDYLNEIEKKTGKEVNHYAEATLKGLRQAGNESLLKSMLPIFEEKLTNLHYTSAMKRSAAKFLVSEMWTPSAELKPVVLDLLKEKLAVYETGGIAISDDAKIAIHQLKLFKQMNPDKTPVLPEFYQKLTSHERAEIFKRANLTDQNGAQWLHLSKQDMEDAQSFRSIYAKLESMSDEGLSHEESVRLARLVKKYELPAQQLMGPGKSASELGTQLKVIGWFTEYAPDRLQEINLPPLRKKLKTLMTEEIRNPKRSPYFSNLKKSIGKIFDIENDPEIMALIYDKTIPVERRLNYAIGTIEANPSKSPKLIQWVEDEVINGSQVNAATREKILENLMIQHLDLAPAVKARWYGEALKNPETRASAVRTLFLMQQWKQNETQPGLLVMKHEMKQVYPDFDSLLKDHPSYRTDRARSDWYNRGEKYVIPKLPSNLCGRQTLQKMFD